MIDRQEAPPMPVAPCEPRYLKQLTAILGELAPDKVAKIELTEDEKLSSIRNQLYLAAMQRGTRVQVWDQGGVLYVGLMDGDRALREGA